MSDPSKLRIACQESVRRLTLLAKQLDDLADELEDDALVDIAGTKTRRTSKARLIASTAGAVVDHLHTTVEAVREFSERKHQ
jgi:hypothetical protein